MGFITARNRKLYKDEKEIRFLGCNMYGLGRVSENQAMQMLNDAKDDGYEAVRFWAFEPTDKNHFEFLCNHSSEIGLYLLPVLADKWGYLQNYKISNDWYREGFKSSYIRYASDMVRTFKNREEIILWEIINEPVTDAIDAIHYFTDTVTKKLKTIDPNHLFSIGTVGGIGDKFGNLFSIFSFQNFKKLYSLPGLDVISIHDYSHDSTLFERLQIFYTLFGKYKLSALLEKIDSFANRLPDKIDRYWINRIGRTKDLYTGIRKIWRNYNKKDIELSHDLKKPIYAGEVGFKRKHGKFREDLIEYDFRKKIYNGFSGYFLWSHESTGASYDGHGYGISTGEFKGLNMKLKKIKELI